MTLAVSLLEATGSVHPKSMPLHLPFVHILSFSNWTLGEAPEASSDFSQQKLTGS